VLALTSDSTASGLFKSVEPVASSLSGKKLSSTSTIYDSAGRVAETDNSSGLSTGTLYYPNGQVQYSGILSEVSKDLGAGNWETLDPSQIFDSYSYYQYDKTDNLPTGAVSYDIVTDAKGHTTKTYKDVLGREIKTVYDDGSFTQTLYSVGDQAISGFDLTPTIPAGGSETIKIAQRKSSDPIVATICVYDAAGRLTDEYLPAVADPLNSNTTTRPHWHYTYDANGNELSQTDPKGHTTSFTYDEFGNRTSRTLPGGESESWTYDSFGRMLTHIDFKGQSTKYIYDNSSSHGGQLIEEDRFTGAVTSTPDEKTVYIYDLLGRQAEVDEYSGSTQTRATITTYDPITGNIASETSPEGTINYEYDPATGQHTRTFTTNNDTHYDYDVQGRLSHVTVVKLNGVMLSTPQVTTYTYDADSDLKTVTNDNATATSSDDLLTNYTYDDLNRLTDETVTRGSSAIFSEHYILSSNGERTHVSESREDGSTLNIDWTYDALNRLTDEVYDSSDNSEDFSAHYTFDLAGNRINKTQTGYQADTITSQYNDRDELTEETSSNSGETDFGYDDNGSMITQDHGSEHDTYTWDLRNRMSSATVDGVTTNYAYDNDNVRVAKISGGNTELFLNDKLNPTGYAKILEEKTSATSAPTRSYVLGLDIIAQRDTGGSIIDLVKDGHGTTRALIDSSGVIVARYNFNAYDNPIGFTESTTTDYYAPDGISDPETGFINQINRYSDRETDQFISRDPIIFGAGSWQNANLHLYVGGNPVNYTDSNGQFLDGLIGLMLVAGGRFTFEVANFATRLAPAIVTATSVAGAVFLASTIDLALEQTGFLPRNDYMPYVWGISGAIFSAGLTLQEMSSMTAEVTAPIRGSSNGKFINGIQANAESASAGYPLPPYSPNTLAAEGTVSEDADLVRLYTPGSSSSSGRWVMPRSQTQGLSLQELKSKFSLPFLPTNYSEVGATGNPARVGIAGTPYGGIGGGVQVELLNSRIATFKDMGAIPPGGIP
jgi:RHS repeat-associated protein